MLASTTEKDRLAKTRNVCNTEGYESFALIALRVGDERLGVLQLNDRRKGHFTPGQIAMWERLADHLAVALAKFQAEDALHDAKARAELYLDLMGHDINNMHQIALGYLELARDTNPDGRAGRAAGEAYRSAAAERPAHPEREETAEAPGRIVPDGEDRPAGSSCPRAERVRCGAG